MKGKKTVTFEPEPERRPAGENTWVKEVSVLVFRLLYVVLEVVWRWAGARGGVQEVEEYGGGFQGWYWRGSVYSVPYGDSRRGSGV